MCAISSLDEAAASAVSNLQAPGHTVFKYQGRAYFLKYARQGELYAKHEYKVVSHLNKYAGWKEQASSLSHDVGSYSGGALLLSKLAIQCWKEWMIWSHLVPTGLLCFLCVYCLVMLQCYGTVYEGHIELA